jgi:hypothetical protein
MIGIYKYNEKAMEFELLSSGDFSLPGLLTVTPGGSSAVAKFYIRNSDPNKFYPEVSLSARGLGNQLLEGASFVIKLCSGDARPSENTWNSLPPNDESTLGTGNPPPGNLPPLGNEEQPDTKYYPFWLRMTPSKSMPVGELRLSFRVSATESIYE